jgi:hypothetical protein
MCQLVAHTQWIGQSTVQAQQECARVALHVTDLTAYVAFSGIVPLPHSLQALLRVPGPGDAPPESASDPPASCGRDALFSSRFC